MCIYLTLLLFYQFLGVFTFHNSARSAQLMWATSGTCHILASHMPATALHRFVSRKNFILLYAGSQANNVPRFCRQWHHQPNKYLDKDKTECVDKDKVLIPRSGEAAPTPCSRPSRRNDATPVLCSRPSHAALTPLPRRAHASFTPLPRRADAPLTPQWRRSRAALTPIARRNDATPVPCWHCNGAAPAPCWRRSRASDITSC